MLISNKFNGYVAGRRTYHTGMEPILLGAAIGGGTSALRGGNPLQGALLGGLTGGVGNFALTGTLPSFLGSAASAAPVTALTSPAAAGVAAAPEAAVSALAPVAEGAVTAPVMGSNISSFALPPQGIDALAGLGADGAEYMAGASNAAQQTMNPMAAQAAAQPSGLSFLGEQGSGFNVANRFTGGQQPPRGLMELWKSLSPEKKMLYGGGGMLGLMALMGQKGKVSGQAPYNGPLSRFNYDPSKYVPMFAKGGIADLGGYSDGGRLLKGPGDGMSDHIPATIAQKQPARLADGEFVIPADVVSHLGNGSTDAGAKQLYAMMDRVRAARTGNKKQGKEIDASKFLSMPKKRKAKRFFGGGVNGDGGEANAAAAEGAMSAASVDAPDGQEGMMSMGDVNAALAAEGLAGIDGGFYGANDYFGQYGGQGAAAAAKPEERPEYKPQAAPSANTNIYRPSYTNYAKSSTPAISDYGTDMQSPFGEFMNPFAQASASGGIGSLFRNSYPAFDDYGLSGLNR